MPVSPMPTVRRQISMVSRTSVVPAMKSPVSSSEKPAIQLEIRASLSANQIAAALPAKARNQSTGVIMSTRACSVVVRKQIGSSSARKTET